MTSQATARTRKHYFPRMTSLPILPTVALAIIAGLWLFWAYDSPVRTGLLVGVAILASLALRLQSEYRARSETRWRTAVERYTQEELVQAAYPRRRFHARPKSQAR
jgi:hypothetical protein